MRIHVVAVAGTGMGSLAGLLAELGHQVSGSDVTFDPPMGPNLERWGIVCQRGFSPEHVADRPELVVIGNVCRKDNVEARAAIDGGLPYTHIAGALQRFVLEGAVPLVVGGTHGKTTTSALCAWILDRTWQSAEAPEARPGFLIGGLPLNFDRSFRAASPGAPFVIEGDEYDTAFFEKTAKFLHYRAEVAILTSIEHDHVDIYLTFESYRAAFAAFVAALPTKGLLVANLADPVVVELARSAPCPVAYYGTDAEHRRAELPEGANVWTLIPRRVDRKGTSFSVATPGGRILGMTSPFIGMHNARNAVAALVACHVGCGVDLDAAAASLSEFRGIKRRQELCGTPAGVFVYDDFAHHPSAVQVTLEGLRAHHFTASDEARRESPRHESPHDPSSNAEAAEGAPFRAERPGRLFAVFEPRSATACRSMHQSAYTACFDAADEILFAPLGRSGLSEAERLDPDRICRELREHGKTAENLPSTDAIVEHVAHAVRPGDVVAVLSNGAFDGIHEKLIDAIARVAKG